MGLSNSEKVVAWQKKHPDRYKKKMREWRMRTIYGITLEEYEERLKKQDGKCAICGKSPTNDRRLAVDHCHKSGEVRSLLCHTCNNHLGIFERRRADFENYLSLHGRDNR